MTELWIIGIIGLLSVIETIIASKGSLFDNRCIWYKRLTKRGIIVASIGLVIVLLSIWQFTTLKDKDDGKALLQIKQRRTSDSIISAEIKKGVELNSKKLFNDISEAFAKQSLKIDTLNKNIQIVRDSAKTVIMNSPREDPIIIVREDGITLLQKNDTTVFKLSIVSTQAPSSIIFIDYFCEVNFTNGSKKNTKLDRLFGRVIKVPKEGTISRKFYLYPNKEIDFINIALIGKYTLTGSNKEILLQDVYQYSLKEKTVGFLFQDEKKLFFEKYNFLISSLK